MTSFSDLAKVLNIACIFIIIMENFKFALEAFLRQELERDELVLQLEQLLNKTPTLYAEIGAHLTKLRQIKSLSTEDYSTLHSLIEPYEKTRIATAPRRGSSHWGNNNPKSTTNGSAPSFDWTRPSKWLNEEIVLEKGLIIRDNYRLEEEVGEGGMGVVWKAVDLIQEAGQARDSHVAIKFFSQDFKEHPDALKALVREFHRYKRLNHPNIVKAHGLDRLGSTFFLVMEFLKGIPLKEFIKDHKNGLSLNKAKPIIKNMAHALAHAHQEGIGHLDFKPDNVFYDPDTKTAKVIDFGIARPLKQSERDETRFDPGSLGALTDAYASNEMLLNLEPDTRDDIYGLACVTYELLSGKHPFNRKKATTAEYEKLSPKPIRGLTKKQNKALLRALAFQRKKRTLTANQFLAELFPKKDPFPWVLVSLLLIVLGTASFAGWKYLYKPSAPSNQPAEPVFLVSPPPVPVVVVEHQPDEQAIDREKARLAELEKERARLAELEKERARLAELEKAKQAKIANLLQECQKHLDAKRLTTGSQGTALVCYREVLKLEAENAKALEGLQEIERRYKQWAENAFRTNKLNKVRQYVKRLEMVNPKSPILAELRQRLENER